MNSFDNIGQDKDYSTLECIAVTKQDAFETKIKNGELISMSHTQTNPYMLYVEVDYEDRETVIFPLLLIWM